MLLALVLAAALAPADEPVARVNASFIRSEALAARLVASRQRGTPQPAEAALEELVSESLLADEGERLGLARDEAVAAEVTAAHRRLAAERFAAVEIEGAVKVDDSMLREVYHLGDTARLQLVVVASREKAQAIRDRLGQGADFAAEARHSLDPAAVASGGDAGARSRAQLDPALARAVFAAEKGALVGPVELKLGWAVARVKEKSVGDEAGFAARRDALAQFAWQQAVGQAVQHYKAQMRARAGVKIDEAFLKGLGTRIEPTAAEREHVIATVKGRPIRYGDILPAVRRLSAGKEGGHASGATVKTLIAWSEVDGLLLEEEAIGRGYDRDPAVAEAARAFEREAGGRAAAERIRRSAPAPAEAEVAAWYREHQADYREPGRRACSHIVLHSRDRAEQVRGWLAAGEPFEALAATYSTDGTTSGKGGALGEVADDRIQALSREAGQAELAAALRDAPPGTVAGPVRSSLGWHLVRCGPPTAPRVRPLPEVRQEIAARLQAERAERALAARVAELRGAARVTVERDAVARAAARARPANFTPSDKP